MQDDTEYERFWDGEVEFLAEIQAINELVSLRANEIMRKMAVEMRRVVKVLEHPPHKEDRDRIDKELARIVAYAEVVKLVLCLEDYERKLLSPDTGSYW